MSTGPLARSLRRGHRADSLRRRSPRVRPRLPERLRPFRLWRDVAGYSTPRRLDPWSSGRPDSTSSSGCSTGGGPHRCLRDTGLSGRATWYRGSRRRGSSPPSSMCNASPNGRPASGAAARLTLPAKGAKDLRPGVRLEFTLSAAGLTHEVVSIVTVVEPPRRLNGTTSKAPWRRRLARRAGSPGGHQITLSTDYMIRPAWLDKLAHKPFFRRLTEDLLKRSMRRFDAHLRYG